MKRPSDATVEQRTSRGPYRSAYTPEQLNAASKAYLEKTIRLNAAARQYGVPKATLWRTVDRLRQDPAAMAAVLQPPAAADSAAGAKCVSSKLRVLTQMEEDALVELMLKHQQCGRPMDKHAVSSHVMELLSLRPRRHPAAWDRSGVVGDKWLSTLYARHPELSGC